VFTGLIECLGTVRGLRRSSTGASLDVHVAWPDGPAPSIGDSIAVNGACLTAAALSHDGFTADLSPETLGRTLFSELRVTAAVNIERALRLGDRLGGHLVQGHVDGVTRILSISPRAGFARWKLALPADLRSEVARKGSVALDGVSLTVADIAEDWFEVELIPQTLQTTTLGRMDAGGRLHLETDVLAKYVARRLGSARPSALESMFGEGGAG
jgi:riboflavin synthase